MVRVLMTGPSGLIGTHAATACSARGLDVVALEHARDDLLAVDAAARVLDRERPDVVVHLAWCASGSVGYRTSPDNVAWVDATTRLWHECRRRHVHLLAVGTAVDTADRASDPYTVAKVALRRQLSSAIDGGALGWLRPHYVFDPERGRPELVRHAQEALDGGRPVELATPASRHDFVHAADVGTAVATAAVRRLAGPLDVGAGRCHRVSDLVERLGATWRPGPSARPGVQHDERPADTRPLRAEGWAPDVTEEFFADG